MGHHLSCCVILVICIIYLASDLITNGKTEAHRFYAEDNKKGDGVRRNRRLVPIWSLVPHYSAESLCQLTMSFNIFREWIFAFILWVYDAFVYLYNSHHRFHKVQGTSGHSYTRMCEMLWHRDFFFPNLCIYRPFSRGNFTGRAFGSFARRWKALASWMEFSSCVTAPR